MKLLVTRNAKAIAAAGVGVATAYLARHGLNLDPNVEVGIIGLVTAVIVYFVPNTPAPAQP